VGIYQVNNAKPRRAIFLDRDGVINKALLRDGKPYPPASLAEVEILPEARSALEALKTLGFELMVVTNQPDVARGSQSRQNVEAIHAYLEAALPIDKFFVCYHDDQDQCNCRKPAPGLLLAAAQQEGIDLSQSYMIGDRWRDIEAGKRAGCTTIFIDYGYSERQPKTPDFRVRSLIEAVEIICGAEVAVPQVSPGGS
jgi:D-glycero-D-manno-heptose 1,7-bisphosphate phosphatase